MNAIHIRAVICQIIAKSVTGINVLHVTLPTYLIKKTNVILILGLLAQILPSLIVSVVHQAHNVTFVIITIMKILHQVNVHHVFFTVPFVLQQLLVPYVRMVLD